MKSEQIKQSLESQLQMARPKRAEIKRVPLTPEEKEFLGKIMDKAVAAEKAGRLAEAIGHYTDYKNELLKIKEKKADKEIKDVKVARAHLISWAQPMFSWEETAANYVDATFVLDELPAIKTKSDLSLNNLNLDYIPNNLHVNGILSLTNSTVEKMPAVLYTEKHCNLTSANIDFLPNTLIVEGSLFLTRTVIKNKRMPVDFYVGEHVTISKSDTEMIEQLEKLKEQGKIKGNIILENF